MCRFAITVRHTALLHSWEQNISTFHISSERQNSLYVTQGIILNHRPTVDWILEHSAQCCRLAVKLVVPSFVVWRRRWCRRLCRRLVSSFGVTVVGVVFFVGVIWCHCRWYHCRWSRCSCFVGVGVVVLFASVSLFCSRRCRRLVSSFGVIVGVVVGVAVVGFVVSVVVGVVGVVGDTACWRCRRFCRF